MYAYMCRCLWKTQMGIGFPGAEVTRDCEPLAIGWRLTWSSARVKELLTAKPSFQNISSFLNCLIKDN